ncbi:transglycosylase SLT domain-containing protein [Alloacidobacterium dinghuense]|uniref:Transglycosylase SLT domain-containing protein n=2 Tax=Alloacidobacterium dinghuense TaxID=2763107 RepID=A0A7G8BR07_9BACT|nr:transglycosylase SLT domain-containing protein [Alloacidobacterium dinghuense]
MVAALALAGALSAVCWSQDSSSSSTTHKKHASSTASHTTGSKTTHSTSHSTTHKTSTTHGKSKHRRPLSAKAKAKSHKLQQAFVASSQLRPMAQQLASMRTPAAYAGVSAYAHSHTGEASAAAYLAVGHAYLLDRKFPEAVNAFRQANIQGDALDDYADYLEAQADLQSNNLSQAETILSTFAQRHPDSIFVPSVPVLQANLFLQEGDPQAALRILDAHKGEAIANRADYQLALAKADQMAGRLPEATQLYRHTFLGFPLSNEAAVAKTQLAAMGATSSLTIEERSHHADALYKAGRFADAAEEYHALANDPGVTDGLKGSLLVAAANCDWKLKRLNKNELDRIPDSSDETGARRTYLLMELARDRDDGETQRNIVEQMETRFPSSPWLNEALYSSGNMYLLRKDFPTAITYYGELAKRFPTSSYAPSAHWRAAWLNYRIGQYSEAARLMDEQIAVYHGGKEIPGALYWRGRLYQNQENRPDMAATYYKTVARIYRHYYYASIAQQRLSELGSVTPAKLDSLEAMKPEPIPTLTDDIPEDDPHVVRAHLLANAGLNEYIAPEIQAADGSDEWGALCEAKIYASYGENWRAMRSMKRAIPFYTSAPIDAIPTEYWRILFPQAYWSTIKSESEKNGLDPYMVAALIRQETEFNPGAISNKSAYGLMQLLPSVGKSMAKEEGIHHFATNDLLDPNTNIRLGTRYLRQTLDRFNSQPEYTFAAYNAGDNRVTDWQSIGNYKGMDEFVESIPFTETRDYVQAIIRNEEIYRELDHASNTLERASATH